MKTDKTLQDTIDASCNRLEKIASSMGVALSKTPTSVTDLEDIIRALLDMKADSTTLSGATFMVGTYLGEIIRAKVGGYWHNSSDNVLLLTANEIALAPVEKVRKFSSDPIGADSLSFFASAVLSENV